MAIQGYGTSNEKSEGQELLKAKNNSELLGSDLEDICFVSGCVSKEHGSLPVT